MEASNEAAVETAILALLHDRAEIYPAHLVAELRRRDPALSPAHIRDALDRLYAQRRVARLWHRYLLAEAVPDVRARWLAMLDRRSDRLGPPMVARARAVIQQWDGWRSDHDPKRSRA